MSTAGMVLVALLGAGAGALAVAWRRAHRTLTLAQRRVRQLEVQLSNAHADAGPFELQRVVDALPVAAVICDDTGTVQVCNPAGAALLAPRIESALVGRTVREALAEASAGQRVRRTEELVGPPLERYTVNAIPLDGGGAVVVVQDESDVARTEAVRRDFVANISHELKTPVGAVALLAEMLADEHDPATAQRFATRLEGEAVRLARTVDDLLELTQIEFGLPDGSSDVAMDEVVEEVLGRVASVAGDRGISVSGPDEPTQLVVRGDARQLGSALYNLVDNAVKYSADGGMVRVGLRRERSGLIDVEVTDEGIGIPGADLERIFERFYRVDRARGRDTGGTGLGLAIVRHVSQNHGGSVDVRSTEGIGTTFLMRLPGREARR